MQPPKGGLHFLCKTFGNGKNKYYAKRYVEFIADNVLYYIVD